MKPLSDIKEFLYKQNTKTKTDIDGEKKSKIVDQTTAMITLKNGEKVPLKSLSKSFRKRFKKTLRSSHENKLLSLDKITDELVNIKSENPFEINSPSNPFNSSAEQSNNDHQPKLNTKKGSKLIHMNETENFKKLLPTLTSGSHNNINNGEQKSNTFQNIKEIIKLRNQNGF
ncbi:hypothetical protein QEN19_003632 [Hanseniaspora menglaensis]